MSKDTKMQPLKRLAIRPEGVLAPTRASMVRDWVFFEPGHIEPLRDALDAALQQWLIEKVRDETELTLGFSDRREWIVKLTVRDVALTLDVPLHRLLAEESPADAFRKPADYLKLADLLDRHAKRIRREAEKQAATEPRENEAP